MTVNTNERPGSGAPRHAIKWRGGALALAGSLLLVGAATAPATAAERPPLVPAVVVTEPGTSPASVVDAVGGRVTRRLPLVHGVAARVPRGSLSTLRSTDGVRSAVRDLRYTPRADSTAIDPDAGLSLRSVRTVIGVDRLAPAAPDAEPVDVAVVDTGVAPVRGLSDPGKVVNGPDFSADRSVRGQEHLDAFGHGTHMAGIVAAVDAPGRFSGVAPAARVVNVRVADHEGSTSLSRLLAGIDWVVRNRTRDDLDIRVLNLSFGAQVDGSYRSDPLALAVERAWQRGIVVVTAAGNNGPESGGLDSPAYDPYVIAVGASDTVGTDAPADDVLAEFTSFGTAQRTPDVVAPGVGIVSLRVPGGFLDTAFPGARIGDNWFRGSGTSQAAAVVSGAAALLLERRPDLGPDEVKALLRGSARLLAGADARGQGAGVVDVAAAVAAPVGSDAAQRWPRAGLGGVWRARGELGLELAVERGTGEDWSARRWTARRWTGDQWDARRWTTGDWSARRWTAGDWSARRWTSDGWSARRWTGFAWEAPPAG
jgi:serine protease AprX